MPHPWKTEISFKRIPDPNPKDLITISTERKAVTTSLMVAEYFDKRHDHVIRDISVLTKKGLPNFGESNYLNKQGKTQPMYTMDRTGFTLLAMGFTGDRALDFKIRYIQAFDAMEAELMKQREEEITQRYSHANQNTTADTNAISNIIFNTCRTVGLFPNTAHRISNESTKEITGKDATPYLPAPPPREIIENKPDPKLIPQRLKEIREEKGILQKHLSVQIFGDCDIYGRMERGQIPISDRQLVMIMNSLKIKMDQLPVIGLGDMIIPSAIFRYVPGIWGYLGMLSVSTVDKESVVYMTKRCGAKMIDVGLQAEI